MKLTTGKAILALYLSVFATQGLAQNLQELDSERAQRVAEMLVGQAGQIDSPQVKVDADVTQASGLRIDNGGVVVVPQKGLSETGDNSEVESKTGAALAFLFMSEKFCPVIEGKQVAESKLRILNVTDRQGVQRNVKCFLLAVRKLTDEDWRLYVYGTEKSPLSDSQFAESTDPSQGPVALVIDDVAGKEGTLTVTVFGKYQAGFRVSYAGR